MKIKLEVDDNVFEFEQGPMAPERFNAVCNLVRLAIIGAVLLGAIHLVGFCAIPWAVGALALVGLYKISKYI